MVRTKIAELGRLHFLDDGGLVCSVTSLQPPPLGPSICAAAIYWASPGPSELAVGDLVVHSEHGVGRYQGSKKISQGDREVEHLVLEFAEGARLYVPDYRRGLLQPLKGKDIRLSSLGTKGGQWQQSPQSYCIEALPNAYEWPGVAPFPELPPEPSRGRPAGTTAEARKDWHRALETAERRWSDTIADWRRACAAYQKALHADASYRQAAQEYFQRQSREPQRWLDWWIYRGIVLRVEAVESANADEPLLLIKQYVLRRERKIEKVRREVEAFENSASLGSAARESIPEHVRLFVWRRDKGRCVRCGSRERLEFDHIIPVVAGGSNTERNIQLLCEPCN